jgi:nicotinamidase-related amidase
MGKEEGIQGHVQRQRLETRVKQIPLIVVDMQNKFTGVNQPWLIRNVVKHVKAARKSNVPVVLVEMCAFGSTNPEIKRVLKGYGNYTTVKKYGCDGSVQVSKALQEKWKITSPVTLKMLGIYTGACVEATADGLVGKGYQVKVIEEACYGGSFGHDAQIELWENTQKVQVIYKRRRWYRKQKEQK